MAWSKDVKEQEFSNGEAYYSKGNHGKNRQYGTLMEGSKSNARALRMGVRSDGLEPKCAFF